MKISGIYFIINFKNGKIYIGSATDIISRLNWHWRALSLGKHHSILLQRSYDKHGPEAFDAVIAQEVPVPDLLKAEQFWLDGFLSYEPEFGYNLYKVAGSPLGRKHAEESKRLISLNGKGLKRSNETKSKMSAYHLDRPSEHVANRNKALELAALAKIKETNNRTHCVNGHELTESNIWYREYKHGVTKNCKTCRNLQVKAYQKRKGI